MARRSLAEGLSNSRKTACGPDGIRAAIIAGMLIKIHHGTTPACGRSLCETCRNSTITRGPRLEDEIVRCEAQPMTAPVLIRFKVTECSAYVDVRLPTYAQLLEQAWILRPTSGRRLAGFVRSSELRDDEFRQLLSDLHQSE